MGSPKLPKPSRSQGWDHLVLGQPPELCGTGLLRGPPINEGHEDPQLITALTPPREAAGAASSLQGAAPLRRERPL